MAGQGWGDKDTTRSGRDGKSVSRGPGEQGESPDTDMAATRMQAN